MGSDLVRQKAARQYIGGLAPALREVASKYLTAERLVKVAVAAIHRQPEIANCSNTSVAVAMLTCAQLGLEPESPMQFVHLVPIKGVLNVWIGFRGYLELGRRSGLIARNNSGVVYAAEIERGAFEASLEPPSIRHGWIPDFDRADADLRVAYAVVDLVDGRGQVVEVLSRKQIEDRRKQSQATGKAQPWQKHYPSMARKSAVRALFQSGNVPMSSEMQIATRVDEAPPEIVRQFIDVPPAVTAYTDMPAVPAPAVTRAEAMVTRAEVKAIAGDRGYSSEAFDGAVDAILGDGAHGRDWTPAESARALSLLPRIDVAPPAEPSKKTRKG